MVYPCLLLHSQYIDYRNSFINPLDPNQAVAARAVFSQSGRSRPEKQLFFVICPQFSKKEQSKKYNYTANAKEIISF